MDQNISFLLKHLLHPGIVLRKELYDTLFWKILNLEHFVGVTRIIFKGSVKESSARTDGGDTMLL